MRNVLPVFEHLRGPERRLGDRAPNRAVDLLAREPVVPHPAPHQEDGKRQPAPERRPVPRAARSPGASGFALEDPEAAAGLQRAVHAGEARDGLLPVVERQDGDREIELVLGSAAPRSCRRGRRGSAGTVRAPPARSCPATRRCRRPASSGRAAASSRSRRPGPHPTSSRRPRSIGISAPMRRCSGAHMGSAHRR